MAEILDILGTKESQSISKLLLELLSSALLNSKKTEEKPEPQLNRVCKSVPVSPSEKIETRMLSKSDDESYHTSPDPTLGRPRYQWQKSLSSSNDLQRDRNKEKRDTFSVFVGHLPCDITDDELADLFKDIGEVADSFVHPAPTQSSGYTFGFVRFWNLSEAKDAVNEKNMLVLGNRKISVELASDTRKKIAGNNDDQEEEDSKLLRKDYPKAIPSHSKENDDKMVMNKIKESLSKLQEVKSWGGSSSEQIISNLREILKLLINYPMGLSEPSACEGCLPSVAQNDSSSNTSKESVPDKLQDFPLHSVSIPLSTVSPNQREELLRIRPVVGDSTPSSSDRLQTSSTTVISSSCENIEHSLMDNVQLPRESISGDCSLTCNDFQNEYERSLAHFINKNEGMTNGLMDRSPFAKISSEDTTDDNQKNIYDGKMSDNDHCRLTHDYHDQVVSHCDENKELKEINDCNVPPFLPQSVADSGVEDMKTETMSNPVVIKRRKHDRSLAPSFANPSVRTNVVKNGYESISQLLDYKYSDLFSDLVIEDDPESVNLKKQLDRYVKKSVELENILIQESSVKRKTVREVFRGNSTNSVLEIRIHAAEIAFQKKKEMLSSRIAEQELVFEKERLHASINADFPVKIAKEMKKDRLKNEIIIAELKYNILEMKENLLKERGEN